MSKAKDLTGNVYGDFTVMEVLFGIVIVIAEMNVMLH